MKPEVVAIIQARMQATRLPGKVLLPLAGESVLWWMAKRATLAKLVDRIVIATTNNKTNDPIERWHILYSKNYFSKLHLFQYSGNEDNVMGRALTAARKYKADIIVDLTADCPMVDPRYIDMLIQILLDKWHLDYVSNCVPERSWPDGLDIQAYWTDALMRCRRALNPERHCGYNIGMRWDFFNIEQRAAPSEFHWPELGLTLDTQEDYEMLGRLFDQFGNDPGFHIEDVIRFLRMNPDWITNANVRRKTPEEG